MPFRLQEIHTDNGGEFINDILYLWCRRESIGFTRGRPYKKNDQAYVEQKNWSVPRRLIGYERYDTNAAYQLLQHLYEDVRLYVNFFQPLRKLVSKERLGAKVKKRYHQAQTPYQRLLAEDVLDDSRREDLARTYTSRNIETTLEALWQLTDYRQANSRQNKSQPPLAACG